jgi:hypothetical protein
LHQNRENLHVLLLRNFTLGNVSGGENCMGAKPVYLTGHQNVVINIAKLEKPKY